MEKEADLALRLGRLDRIIADLSAENSRLRKSLEGKTPDDVHTKRLQFERIVLEIRIHREGSVVDVTGMMFLHPTHLAFKWEDHLSEIRAQLAQKGIQFTRDLKYSIREVFPDEPPSPPPPDRPCHSTPSPPDPPSPKKETDVV